MARIPSISGRYASAGFAITAPSLSSKRCNIARAAERSVNRVRLAEWLVPVERIELPTFGLQNRCSTAELNRRIEGPGGRAKTRRCSQSLGGRIPDLAAK